MIPTFFWLLTQISCTSEEKKTDTNQVSEPSGPVEPQEFTNDWGSWLSMSQRSDGNPVVSYYDKTAGAVGFATGDLSATPITWTHEEVDGYTNDQGLDVGEHGKFSTLAVAPDDTIWIAHYDVGLRTLRYATKSTSDTEWSVGVADMGGGSSPDAGWFASTALDADNNPVIAHHDYGKKTLRVAHWNGSAFTGEVIDTGEDGTDSNGESIDANVGQFTDILIDGGVEYITYYDAAQGSLKLAYGTSGSYTIETIDQGNLGQWSSMTISNGTLHIAYHDVGNQDLKYATGTPGAFTIETVDNGDIVGADSDIFVNENSTHIVYFDGKNNDMKKAVRNADTWTTSTVTGNDGALGFHNEIININGTLYAGCYNYSDKVTWFGALE